MNLQTELMSTVLNVLIHSAHSFVLIEAELRSHSARRTDDEMPPATNRPNQSSIQQISRTSLSAMHGMQHQPSKTSSSQLPFSNSKTASKTARRSNNKTQNKTQQKQKKQNHKHRTHEQDMSTLQNRNALTVCPACVLSLCTPNLDFERGVQ